MPRLTIQLPKKFAFTTSLKTRITDINYGNHLGSDTYLSYIHEARVRYLQSLGYKHELDIEGVAFFVSDSAIIYKNEITYGQTIDIDVVASDFREVSFDFYFRMKCLETGKEVAHAKTGMVALDYATRKLRSVPVQFRQFAE